MIPLLASRMIHDDPDSPECRARRCKKTLLCETLASRSALWSGGRAVETRGNPHIVRDALCAAGRRWVCFWEASMRVWSRVALIAVVLISATVASADHFIGE